LNQDIKKRDDLRILDGIRAMVSNLMNFQKKLHFSTEVRLTFILRLIKRFLLKLH